MSAITNMTEELDTANTEINEQQMHIPEVLPVLPLRDIVIYPFMIVPLFVSREKSIRAVDEALGENRMILLVSQRDLDKEEPVGGDLYQVGTVAVIMRMLKLPDGRIRILVQGLSRARVESVEDADFLRARLSVMNEVTAPERSLEVEALVRNVRASMEKAANLGKNISPEVMAIVANLDEAGRLADLAASNLELKVEDAQSVIEAKANGSSGSAPEGSQAESGVAREVEDGRAHDAPAAIEVSALLAEIDHDPGASFSFIIPVARLSACHGRSDLLGLAFSRAQRAIELRAAASERHHQGHQDQLYRTQGIHKRCGH